MEEETKETVETIIQNGVSKEQLQEMLNDIFAQQKPDTNEAEIRKAEEEYFGSHLKY